jgi:hypothetical protein
MDSRIPQVFDHVLKQAFDALCGWSRPQADDRDGQQSVNMAGKIIDVTVMRTRLVSDNR